MRATSASEQRRRNVTKQPKQIGVGIREADAVAVLVCFCPEEHAPRKMQRIATPNVGAAVALVGQATRAA
jgi:hypothetical protein